MFLMPPLSALQCNNARASREEDMVHQHAAQVQPTDDGIGSFASTLKQSYLLHDGERVRDFLSGSPFLVPLLHEAAPVLRSYFPDAALMLDEADDPEVTDDSQVVLSIVASSSVEQSEERLSRFDAEWWLERMPRAQDRLFITLAFA